MRRALAVLALALLPLAGGCSRRERANPLDPSNPTTGGRPAGFDAVAGTASVQLSWERAPELGIDGFQILRRAPGDSVFRPLGPALAADVDRFLDAGLPATGDYAYRLYFVIDGDLSGAAAEDVAGPGPGRPWVVDAGAQAVLRLSPDGRDVVLRSVRSIEPFSLAVDARSGNVWLADPFSNTVEILTPDLSTTRRFTGLQGPYTMAVSPRDGTAWICELDGGLAHVTAAGTPAVPPRIDLLDGPTGVAVHPSDHSVWVAEQDGDRVRHYTFEGIAIASTPLEAPTRVAVDSVSKNAWVTSLDRGRIHRLNELAQPRDSLAFASGPIGIAVDWRRDRVWVADAVGDAVLIIEASTRTLLRRIPGIAEPRDVAVDLTTGECWVAARGEGAVVRLAADGRVLARVGGFVDVVEVRLDPGTQ